MKEAERHITTIHLRPHSWSCANLANPLQAFQCANTEAYAFSSCGFCGQEFRRSGVDAPLTDAESEQLLAHMQATHAFGECTKAKKFYREDLFRQHLKTSHAAESGKWIKFLEKACRADEPPAGYWMPE